MQKEAERIIRGEEKTDDIIINVPVRSGKSLIASVAFNAWVWTIDPTFKIVTASYGDILSKSLSTKTRDLIKSDWYQERFGHIYQLKKDQDTKGLFETTKGGSRFATSTGAAATGMGGHMIIADDLMNPDEAKSPKKRETVNEWYDTTLWTRTDTPDLVCRFIIMQRLSDKDLTGHLLELGGYRHICIPAEAKANVQPASLRKFYKEGLFFIERFTRKILDQFKVALRERGFEAQLNQSPKVASGNIINTSFIKYLDEPPKPLKIIQTMDTAFKDGEENDYSVCMTWCSFRHPDRPDRDSYYLMHVMKGKFTFPDLKKRMHEVAKKFKPSKIIIEDKASGQSLIQEFELDKYIKRKLLRVNPDRDKVTRAHSITEIVEDGFVYFPSTGHWVAGCIEELSLFDSGEFDDQVDTFVYALQYYSKKLGDHREPKIRVL